MFKTTNRNMEPLEFTFTANDFVASSSSSFILVSFAEESMFYYNFTLILIKFTIKYLYFGI